MISKERLEELIEQGATICNQYIDYNNNICYRFGKASIIQDNDEQHIELKLNGTNTSVIMYDTKYLYETEEDARWELEMTATRTETLKLPKWKEFRKLGEFTFYGFHQGKIKMFYDISDDEIKIDTGKDWYIFYKEYNKENYSEACKLCLRLFKGEEI